MIEVTEKALEQIRKLIYNNSNNPIGIRVGTRTKGCSGFSYTFEYAYSIESHDTVVKKEDITILLDPKSSLFLIGTTIDWKDGLMESGFQFINPNEKGRCGCGESFTI